MTPVACCLPAGVDSKAPLSDNWITSTAEAAEAAAATAFNPADPQYNELARRLSKSAAMHKVQDLQASLAVQEKQLQGLTGEAKEAKKAEIEEMQQQLTEAQAALTELQASFEQDPLSLTPWMNALFALADSGVSSFDTGGAVCCAHPPPGVSLLDLMAAPVAAAGGPTGVSAWLYRGAEKVLGTFKRRYELERGPGKLRLVSRLAVSPFGGAASAELAAAAEAGLEATRQAVLGPEAAAAGGLLDTVLLHWLDYEDMDSFIAVLLALKRCMAPAGYDPAAGAGAEAAPKCAGLGLVHPPAAAITAAVRAGVPISCISLPYNLLDTSAAALLDLCRQHGIQVYGSAPTAHGLISEAFLGTAAPDTAAAAAVPAGVDNLAAGLDMVARYGGWGRFQELLAALKGVADKHGTSLQVVALAWVAQSGVVPLLPAHWGKVQGSRAAPWAPTLGLDHFSLDPPPAAQPAAAAVAAVAAEVVAAVAPATEAEGGDAAAEAAAGDAEGEAAAGEGSEGHEGSAEPAEKPAAAAAAAAAAAEPEAAAAEATGKAAAQQGGVGAKVSWVGSLAGLLSRDDVAQLAAVVGRAATPTAA